MLVIHIAEVLIKAYLSAHDPYLWKFIITMLKFYCPMLLTALVFVTGVSIAETDTIYRWSDANGNPVISDRLPPQGTPYTTIDPKYSGRRSRMSDRGTAAATLPESAALPNVPPSTIDAPQTSTPRVSKNPKICQEAQDNISKLETFARIRIEDPTTGEIRFLSDDERQSQLEIAREQANIHCD